MTDPPESIEQICDEVTRQHLRPALEDLGVADADQYRVAYDTTPLAAEPTPPTTGDRP